MRTLNNLLSRASHTYLRNVWRVLTFDIAAPVATIAALVMIGVALRWPLWWASACSILLMLLAAVVVTNFVLLRRNSVTTGTDDNAPTLRLVVVAAGTAASVAAAVLFHTDWIVPDRELQRDSAEVVRIATAMAENASTFSPLNPTVSLDRATAMMVPDRVIPFTALYNKSAAPLGQQLITVEAATLSAGIEVITPSAAGVAVIMRGTRIRADVQPEVEVIALRVTLTKESGRWLVFDVAPIHR